MFSVSRAEREASEQSANKLVKTHNELKERKQRLESRTNRKCRERSKYTSTN